MPNSDTYGGSAMPIQADLICDNAEAYDDFESDPLDAIAYVFSDLEVLSNYTAFTSDPTEVFGFDTEAQP